MSLKTKINNRLKSVLCLVVALVCLVCSFAPVSVYADVVGDLEDQRNELDEEIKENEEKLDQVEGEINKNESKLDKIKSEISDIDDELSELEDKIDELNGDISSLNTDIETLTADIVAIDALIADIEAQIQDSEELMADTKEQLLNRLRENYMAGGGSKLEILFAATDVTSFLERQELIAQMSNNDTVLINEMAAKVGELNSLQAQLGEQKTELESKKEDLKNDIQQLADRQTDLEDTKSTQEDKKSEAMDKHEELKGVIAELDKDSEEYKAEIARQKKERDQIDKQIDEYIRQHGSSQGDTPDEDYNNDGKMLWPVPGSTRMTAGYPAYSNGDRHMGIDIVRTDVTTKGSPFRAAQGGKVIIAKNDGAWNYGFGNYCVIDHGDGKQTLYAHAQTLYVSVGDVVQKGEHIGAIGSTGNSTGPHLHFEVRIKKANGDVSRVQPLDYVSKP